MINYGKPELITSLPPFRGVIHKLQQKRAKGWVQIGDLDINSLPSSLPFDS